MENSILEPVNGVSAVLPSKSCCDVTVIILTYNESMHLARAIESVKNFACEILVVDSFSTDDTVNHHFSNLLDLGFRISDSDL